MKLDGLGYDSERWQGVLADAAGKPLDELRPIYDQFLSLYPRAARYWKRYVEAEVRACEDAKSGAFQRIELLFGKCVESCWSVDLWSEYLRFLIDVKNADRGEVEGQFERALEFVGRDRAAAGLWKEFVEFLNKAPVSYGNKFEEGSRISQVRKVYQRAVAIPMDGVEQLWAEYERFENDLNKTLAKGVLADLLPKHTAARNVWRERKQAYEQVARNSLAVPFQGTDAEIQALNGWKRAILFERANPQKLEPKEHHKVLLMCYEQALCVLYHHPGMWYEASMALSDASEKDLALKLLDEGLVALPDCVLLHLATASLLEELGEHDRVDAVFEHLVDPDLSKTFGDGERTISYIHYMYFVRRVRGIDAARQILLRAKRVEGVSYHLYVAAAAMEYYMNANSQFAQKVLKYGLKSNSASVPYVLLYASFLQNVNKQRELRVLFEKAVETMPSERQIWNAFLQFEYRFGTADSVAKLERRRAAQFPQLDPSGFSTLVHRFAFEDLYACPDHMLATYDNAFHEVPFVDSTDDQPDHGPRKIKLPAVRVVSRPELSKWRIFHPDAPALRSEEGVRDVSGFAVGFRIPAPVQALIDALPGSATFAGVASPDIDAILAGFETLDIPLPEVVAEQPVEAAPPGSDSGEHPLGEPDSTAVSIERGVKRKREDLAAENEALPASLEAGDPVDIFRSRQRQRVTRG